MSENVFEALSRNILEPGVHTIPCRNVWKHGWRSFDTECFFRTSRASVETRGGVLWGKQVVGSVWRSVGYKVCWKFMVGGHLKGMLHFSENAIVGCLISFPKRTAGPDVGRR